ncbi:integrase domain-containing protein [Psychrobacter sp. Ps5]|nr:MULTISPECIES: integrase domain-containing protein [Gammaproteobacteria]MCG3861760.1 integrase domain-containing protein [Psychrobacter sp. Ps5]MCG3866308.1 integrase domain-containing protein [Photobacterium sp. Ph6]
MTKNVRNMNSKNFGLRSSDCIKALHNAGRLAGLAINSTEGSYKSELTTFGRFLKEEQGLRDLRKVDESHIRAYGEYLSERVENGTLALNSAHNYISTMNTAMSVARGNDDLRMTAVKDFGFPEKSGISTTNKAISQVEHDRITSQLNDRMSSIVQLQRELGLRLKESCLINAKDVYKQAIKFGKVKIEDGTKGGREREVPIISSSQIEALKVAAELQGEHYSMTPVDKTYIQFQRELYREVCRGMHGERHHYAQDRYKQITGVKSPIAAGVEHKLRYDFIAKELGITKTEAKRLDHEARMIVSSELGHGRIQITNSYLG